jgi:hypothetical protein
MGLGLWGIFPQRGIPCEAGDGHEMENGSPERGILRELHALSY